MILMKKHNLKQGLECSNNQANSINLDVKFDNQNEVIIDEKIMAQVNEITNEVISRVKENIAQNGFKENIKPILGEFLFYSQILIFKNLLYYTIKTGIEKGYKFKD
jgi:hypothetical protein